MYVGGSEVCVVYLYQHAAIVECTIEDRVCVCFGVARKDVAYVQFVVAS